MRRARPKRWQRVTRRIAVVAFAFLFAAPSVLVAGVTTITDIRSATNYASMQGFCSTSAPAKADCSQVTTRCDQAKWSDLMKVYFGEGDFAAIAEGLGLSDAQKVRDEMPDPVRTFISKDTRNRTRIPFLTEAACFCECGGNESSGVCQGKPKGTPYQARVGERFTREECAAACGTNGMAPKCAGTLPKQELAEAGSQEARDMQARAQEAADINALCFTNSECNQQNGIWEAYVSCKDGKGRCFAKEPEIELNTPIGTITKVQGLNTYIVTAFRYLVSVVAVATTVMFIFGAFIYMLGATTGQIAKGKEIMIDALVGMLLIFTSTLILRTLNPALLTLNPVKVYMVNTVTFINASYCKDLDASMRLADAGQPPALLSYEDVSKQGNAFSIAPKDAACGHEYHIEGSVGGTCEGTDCPEEGRECIACANPDIPECQGVVGTNKVCARLKIAGTIDYADSRVPEAVYLIFFCNGAQASTVQATYNDTDFSTMVKIDTTGRRAGSVTTDPSVSGRATYFIDLTEYKVAAVGGTQASSFCADKGGLRGGLIAVQYNDDKDYALRLITGNDVFETDDFAVLSKSDCNQGGGHIFAGYATGKGMTEWNKTAISRAIHCGLNKTPPRFMNQAIDFWSYQELMDAASGKKPIICDFRLSDANAPTNPSETCTACCPDKRDGYWRADSSAGSAAEASRACTQGGACSEGQTCRSSDNRTCTCHCELVTTGGSGVSVTSNVCSYQCN